MKNKAVFLDRDGTINIDKHFLSNPEELELLPRAGEAIKILKRNGFKIIVISNQSGVGRGHFDVGAVDKVNERLLELLDIKGAKIDRMYYCPHTPEENCDCRKPGLYFFQKAIEEFGISPSESYMVGDRDCDVAAGKNFGCKTILITEGTDKKGADHLVKSLYDAVEWILESSSNQG